MLYLNYMKDNHKMVNVFCKICRVDYLSKVDDTHYTMTEEYWEGLNNGSELIF
jgi:hypothetical protein